MNKLEILINRLEKIGIKTEFIGNYPWIYINTINDKKVTEKYLSDHRFTVMFSNTKSFINIKELFKLIRKYK